MCESEVKAAISKFIYGTAARTSFQDPVSRQPKLCNILKFGMAYCLVKIVFCIYTWTLLANTDSSSPGTVPAAVTFSTADKSRQTFGTIFPSDLGQSTNVGLFVLFAQVF